MRVCVCLCACVCGACMCVCVCVAPGLLSTKDPLKMESSLKAAEELIRKEPSDLSEVRESYGMFCAA